MSGAPRLHEELVPPGEAEVIQRFLAEDRVEHEKSWPQGQGAMRRRLHVKSHGCLHATLDVIADVPAALRHGVFASRASYPAIVRFSNGLSAAQADSERDARGMSIKLIGVAGPKLLEDEADAVTQDLLLLNFPTFLASDAEDFAGFARAVARDGHPFRYFFPANPLRWRVSQARALLRSTAPVRTPIVRYWSQVPILCGGQAVKLSAIPRVSTALVENVAQGPGFLRETLALQLAHGPLDFDLALQVQSDPVRMPVEDARVEWSESEAPFRTVARLHVPQQIFATPAREAYCENLSFTAWHGLQEHRPLGGINRMRKHAYRASSQRRHERSGVQRREPSDIKDFLETAGREPA